MATVNNLNSLIAAKNNTSAAGGYSGQNMVYSGGAGVGGAYVNVGIGGGGGGGGILSHNNIGYSLSSMGSQTSTISKISLNGDEAPEGENFKDCLDLFTYDLRLDGKDSNHFHFLVWIELFGSIKSNYGVVFRNNHGMFPAFGDERTRDQFADWFRDYKEKFFAKFDVHGANYPTPVTGDISGVWIEDPQVDPDLAFTQTSFKRRYLADWAWIAGNCKGYAMRVANGWLFSLDTDAIYFKMR